MGSGGAATDTIVPGAARHYLTVLFADLSGSKKLGASMEAEDLLDVLQAVRSVCHAAVERHGGFVLRLQGDGALAVFGYPQGREDDGRRAAEAALEIHDRVACIRHPGLPMPTGALRMHSGIDAGMVLSTQGDIERGRLDLVGPVPDTAKTLSDLAAEGEILASLQSLGPQMHFFEVGAERSMAVEGRATALAFAPVLRRARVHRRYDAGARRGLTPFVGRASILAQLQDFVLATGAEKPGCAVVVGGAGVGKTRLLEELALRHGPAGALTLRGFCESYLGAEVLQPFRQMLRSLCGIESGMLAPTAVAAARSRVAELLPDRLEALDGLVQALSIDEAAGAAPRQDVVASLGAWLVELSARRPLVLLIDDWQWADDASRQLLERLLQQACWLVVLIASRPRDDGAPWLVGAAHIAVGPFSEGETAQAVRRWLPDADPFTVAEIHRYGGGIPLYVEELCHAVAADASKLRALSQQSGGTRWLAALIASRLARLPARQLGIVRAAAVIGNVLPTWLLERVCGHGVAEADVQALAEADFIFPADGAGMLRYKHGITRDAVYETVGLRQRTAMHLDVIEALEARSGAADAEDRSEALAYHSQAAGLWAAATRHAETAGDRAVAAFALDRGRAHYRAAMDAIDRLPEPAREAGLHWCLLAHKLAMTCIFDPLALTDGLSTFERCVERARELGDVGTLARSAYWLAYLCYGLGRARQGEAHAREALRLAEGIGDERLAAQVRATLGQILAATCDYAESIALLDVAVDAKRKRSRPGSSMAIGSAYALACKGSVLGDRGDFDAAHACFGEALDLLGGSTHPVGNSVRNWVCLTHIWQGHWQPALNVAAESSRIAENTRALLLLATSRAMGAYACWCLHGEPAAFEQLQEAVRWMEARGGAFYTSLHYGWLVEGCLAQNQAGQARRHAARLLMRARQGERLGEAVGCRALALHAASTGRAADALRLLRRADASAQRRGSAREAALNGACRAAVDMHAGALDSARAHAVGASEAFSRLHMPWHAQALAGLRVQLDDAEGAQLV